MPLLEVLFGRDIQATDYPDKVKCTPLMWWIFIRMGPSAHVSYLTSLEAGEKRDPVTFIANKLRMYDSMVHGPLQARISSVETLINNLTTLTTKIQDQQEKMLEKIERNSSQVAPVRTRCPPTREGRQTSRTELWYFLSDHGEDMRQWDRKPTHVLATRVQGLKVKKKAKYMKVSAVPVSRGQGSDQLEGTSHRYLQTENCDEQDRDQY
ncbi:hypothetical protein BTVI_42303 [Pitangus sulphuratus]|nr:hypothetical protein BTVI_42303 [Pitangus sulphuratus]